MTALDLESLGRSVLKLRADVPRRCIHGGRSRVATGRQWSGDQSDGLVLTIGYLVTEATDVWLSNADGREVAAHPLAYDQVTGFGLVLPLQTLGLPPIKFGSSAALSTGSHVHVLSAREFAAPQSARVLARREFAGAWEYLLDEAILRRPRIRIGRAPL